MLRQVSTKGNWKEIPGGEVSKNHWILILVGDYKSAILLQLWSKEDDRLLFSKIMSHQRFQKFLQELHFGFASERREIRNDENLESSGDVF